MSVDSDSDDFGELDFVSSAAMRTQKQLCLASSRRAAGSAAQTTACDDDGDGDGDGEGDGDEDVVFGKKSGAAVAAAAVKRAADEKRNGRTNENEDLDSCASPTQATPTAAAAESAAEPDRRLTLTPPSASMLAAASVTASGTARGARCGKRQRRGRRAAAAAAAAATEQVGGSGGAGGGGKRTKKTSKALEKLQVASLLGGARKNSSPLVINDDDDDDDEAKRDEFLLKLRWKYRIKRVTVNKTARLAAVFDRFVGELNDEEEGVGARVVFRFHEKELRRDDTAEGVGLDITSIVEASVDAPKADDGAGGDGAADAATGLIELKLQTKDRKSTVVVKILPTDKMRIVMEKYVEAVGAAEDSLKTLRFRFDGDDLDPGETAEDLELEGGECIDVF